MAPSSSPLPRPFPAHQVDAMGSGNGNGNGNGSATISSSNSPLFSLKSVTERPFKSLVNYLHCARSAQALAICVNDRLLILDNMITSDSIASHSFPPALHPHPPAIAISPDGEFWAAAAANGDVSVTHVHSKNECFRINVANSVPVLGPVASIFFAIYPSASLPHHNYELILVYKHHVTRIFNLHLHLFSTGPSSSADLNLLANKLIQSMHIEHIVPATLSPSSPPPTDICITAVACFPAQSGSRPSSLVIFTSHTRPQLFPSVSLWHFGTEATAHARSHAGLPSASFPDQQTMLRPASIVKAEIAPDAKSMYTLTDQGHISVWSLPHLVCIRTSHLTYKDFTVFTQPAQHRPGAVTILLCAITPLHHVQVLRTRGLNNPVVSLPLADGAAPGSQHLFATTAAMPKPHALHLPPYSAASVPAAPAEHMLPVILRFRGGLHDGERKLQLLRLQETLPQSQLDALVANQQWEDALKLAKQFLMDVQPVLQHRLKAAVHDELAPVADFAAEIGPLLDQVDSVPVKIDACLSVRCARLADTVMALDRACAMLRLLDGGEAAPWGGSRAAAGTSALEKRVSETRTKLGTFQLLGMAYSPAAWHAFRELAMERQAVEYAAAGDLAKVALVWRRHLNDRKEEFNLLAVEAEKSGPLSAEVDGNKEVKERESPMKRMVDTIVQAIPDWVPAGELANWLRTAVFSAIPVAKKRIIDKWLEERAVAVATRIPGRGAAEGLKLVQLILEPVNVAAFGSTMPVSEQWRTQMYKVKPNLAPRPGLLRLRNQLEDIVYLNEQVDYEVTLTEYKRREPTQIAMGILDRVVALEALQATVANKFDPYIARHDLNRDDILKGYCERVLEGAVGDRLSAQHHPERGGIGCSGGGGGAAQSKFAATWASRVLVLSLLMMDMEKRCQVLLELTSRIAIPWASEIEAAVTDLIDGPNATTGCSAGLEIVDVLRGQYRRMDLYRMLQRYGITASDFDASNVAQARQVNKVFARYDSLQAVNDSLRFAATYGTLDSRSVFCSFLRHHALAMLPDRWREYLEELKSHPLAHYAHMAARGLCGYFAGFLGRPLHPQLFLYPQKEPKQVKAILLANTVALCEFVVAGGQPCASIGLVKSMYRLYRELDGFEDVVPEDIDSPERRLQFFMARSRSLPSGIARRLAEILDIDKVQVHQLLIRQALEDGNGNEALLLANEMLQLQCSVDALLPVLHDFLAYIEGDQDGSRVSTRLAQGMVALSQHCIISADGNSAAEALDIFKLISAFKQVFDQTEFGEYRVAVGRRSLSARDRGDLAHPRSNDSGVHLPSSASHSPNSRSEIALQVEDILPKHYFDQGLVLTSSQIVPKCSNLVRTGLQLLFDLYPRSPSLQLAARQQAQAASSNKKGKAKAKLRADNDPLAVLRAESQSIVKDLMASNQHQLALLVLHVTGSFLANTFLLGHAGMATIGPLVDKGPHQSAIGLAAIASLSSPVVDQTMALGYLLSLDKSSELIPTMNTAKQANDSRLANTLAMCCVGVVVGNFFNEHLFAMKFRDIAKNVVWWRQFDLLGIAFDRRHFPSHDTSNVSADVLCGYVEPLLMATNGDLLVALEFARAFGIGEDVVYLAFIAQHLGVSRSAGHIAMGGSSASLASSSSLSFSASLSMDQAAADPIASIGYKDAVVAVHSEITAGGHPELFAIYRKALTQCDPFDYDRIDFILKQLHTIIPPEDRPVIDRCTKVLLVLSSFEKPASVIMDADVEYARVRGWNEDWASKRLNCLALISPLLGIDLGPDTEIGWRYLMAFINTKTINTLKNLAAPLDMRVDNFYGQVVLEQVIERNQAGNPLQFSDIQPYIEKIQSHETLISVALHASQSMSGHEKVRTIRKALTIAEQVYKDADVPQPSDTMQAQLMEAQRDLRDAEIETLLRDKQLKDSRYLGLVMNPPKLIEQLYLDSPKLLSRSDIEDGFDIHAVAKSVAEIAGLDFMALVRKVFMNMMSTKDEIPEGELPSAGFRFFDWSMQQAAVILLGAYTAVQASNILAEICFGAGEKEHGISNSVRIRALDLVQKMPTKIAKTINNHYSIHLQKLWALRVMHLRDHQHLGIARTLEELKEDPTAVVRSLWLNHRNKSKCPQLIVNICLDFAVNDLDLIDKCLAVLLERKFYSYLSHQLVAVSRAFPAIPNLAEHWRRFLTGFAASIPVRHPSSSEGRDWSRIWTLVENIVDCPLILDVLGSDCQHGFTLLDTVAKHGLEPWLILFSGLPLAEDRAVSALKNASVSPVEALAIVDEWRKDGRHESLCAVMRERLFSYGYETRALKDFVQTPWLTPILKFCMNRGKFSTLVREASHAEAVQLVHFFNGQTRQVVPEGADVVQHYLATHGGAQAADDADDELMTF